MALQRAMTQHSPVAFTGPSTPTCSSCCCCCVGSIAGTAIGLTVIGVRSMAVDQAPDGSLSQAQVSDGPAAEGIVVEAPELDTAPTHGLLWGVLAGLVSGAVVVLGLSAILGRSLGLNALFWVVAIALGVPFGFAVGAAVAYRRSLGPAFGMVALGAVGLVLEFIIGVPLLTTGYPLVALVIGAGLVALSAALSRRASGG